MTQESTTLPYFIEIYIYKCKYYYSVNLLLTFIFSILIYFVYNLNYEFLRVFLTPSDKDMHCANLIDSAARISTS